MAYSSSTPKAGNKVPRMNKEDIQKLEQWIQIPSRFDNFDVRAIDTAAKWALLALYDITKELNVQQAVKPGIAHEYLLRRYKTVPVNRDALSRALRDKDYKKYFSRTSDNLYYLTNEGEGVVESWLNQGASQTPQQT